LLGLSNYQLEQYRERLKELGLVFRYEADRQNIYSAHPFVREFFRDLLGTQAESIHESVRSKLAPSLEARPKSNPRDPKILDEYEFLIEQTLLAGHFREAFDLYAGGMYGYQNLGAALGENTRGLRILELFVPQNDFARLENRLDRPERSVLVKDLGLFAKNLGDLRRSRRALRHSLQLAASWNAEETSKIGLRLAFLELDAGHFRQALNYSLNANPLADAGNSILRSSQEDAISKADFSFETRLNSIVFRAAARFFLGDISAALSDFQRADELSGLPLSGLGGAYEVECKILLGERLAATAQMQHNRQIPFGSSNSDLCRYDALLARLVLPDHLRARRHLEKARAFANRSGDVELKLRCFQAACEFYRYLRDYSQAIDEAQAGIELADACDLGKYSIDLRLALAEALLAACSSTDDAQKGADDAQKALRNSRNALYRSEGTDCEYAWGKADALHLCGLAHLQLGERELAGQRLTAALELRDRLGHGRIEVTRRALELLQ